MSSGYSTCSISHYYNYFCYQCKQYVCQTCFEMHKDHNGKVKDFEELSNIYLPLYQDRLNDLKLLSKTWAQLPSEESINNIKVQIKSKLFNAYDTLIAELISYRDLELKRIYSLIDSEIEKYKPLKAEVSKHFSLSEEINNAINKLNETGTKKSPRNDLIQYTNEKIIGEQQSFINEVKNLINRTNSLKIKMKQFENFEINPKMKESYLKKLFPMSIDQALEDYLLIISPSSKQIIMANIVTKKKRTLNLKGEVTIPLHFEQATILSKIYLCGGSNSGSTIVNSVFQIDLVDRSICSIMSMHTEKIYHGLTTIGNLSLITVGGASLKGCLRVCEIYDTKYNRWDLHYPLNEEREGCSVVIVKMKNLYCFGGRNSKGFLNSIESMDISFPKMGWSIFTIDIESWKGCCFSGCYPISNKEILIFGGVAPDNSNINDCYIFYTKNQKINSIKSLENHDCFLGRDIKIHNREIYAIGYSTLNIHIYDIDNRNWKIILSS